jgi:hypothetical protein
VPGDERPPAERRLSPESGPPAPPADPLPLLEHGELRLLGLMPYASNSTFLAEVALRESTALVVYKPRRGEAPLWDFPEGTLCHREVAAYRLSAALGWPNVPPTVLREGPLGAGSVQLFVPADPAEHYFTLREGRLDAFRAIAAFDVVANNADRKGGHCLLGEDEGSIWVIDHGVCFAEEPKLRTVIWDFAGERVPAGLLADVARVAEELCVGPARRDLGALLDEAEVAATRRRAEALARSGRFPRPGPGRPYPWPPV